jgi:hypothetical protein
MQALRIILDVAKDGYLHVRVPQDMGKKFEVIVIPIEEEIKDESLHAMRLQEESGFAKNVLASADEDVWNEV